MEYLAHITSEEIEALPVGAFDGQIIVIDHLGEDFDNAIEYLKSQPLLGFDTETKPVFDRSERPHHTALVQISSLERAYLFRLDKIKMQQAICDILANDGIIKIGAAVADDIRGLQKMRSFRSAAMIDLQKFVEHYGIEDKAVKKLAAIILGIKISKSQQCSNWEAPEYSESQLSYAATDAWVCLKMYLKLLGNS